MFKNSIINFLLLVMVISGCRNAEKNPNENDSAEGNVAVENGLIGNQEGKPFQKEVSYKTIKFLVNSPGYQANNNFVLIPSGLSEVNDTMYADVTGMVQDVIIDDIDGDDSPEVAIIISNGSEDFGSAYVYSANKGKSLSIVNLEDVSKRDIVSYGYKGHDKFNFVEGTFVRRFPIFYGDSSSGKTRQLQFKLRPGEAMKQLILDRVIEY